MTSGKVHVVAVTPGLASDVTGSTTQDLYWRQGLFRYHAEVVMNTSDVGAQSSQQGDIAVRIGHDIVTELVRDNPSVKTVPISRPHLGMQIHGWLLPEWLGWIVLIAALGTLKLLVSGPQPWRATRWAWFWLIMNPAGPVLFLLLAGPTPPLPSPRHPKRRLTGKWAFLLGLLIRPLLPRW